MKKLIIVLSALLMLFGCKKEETKPEINREVKTIPTESRRNSFVVEAVKKIENSVVNIRTEKIITTSVGPNGEETLHGENYFNDFFGQNKTYKTHSLGSGVIVKEDGTVITNYHVIESASKIYVLMNDNSVHEAEFIGGDNIIDIAILKIKGGKGSFPTAKLGNSDNAMLGETVIAMGNPYGLNSSITTGVISSVKRIINLGLGYSVFMQTDALINPGNSGGPLVNLDGEVIGINSAVVQEAQGIGFSIPINTAMRIMPEILANGKIRMGYIGISVTEVREKDGIKLLVTGVEDGSNAEEIGIKKGDIILQINEIPVSSLLAMSNMLRSYPKGSQISLVVERGLKTFKGKILMADYPKNYGINLFKQNYGLTFVNNGKFVVVSESTMSDSLRHGDVLIAFEDTEIKSLQQLNNVIMDNLGKQIKLNIYRYGVLIRLKMQI